MIAKRFISRPDVKAVQTGTGAYYPDRRNPFTVADIDDHIAGRKTFGHYMVGKDGMCKFGVFDIDMGKDLITHDGMEFLPRDAMYTFDHPGRPYCVKLLRTVAEGLASLARRKIGGQVLVSFSGGKGMHVYVIPKKPLPAKQIRTGVQDVMLTLHPAWAPTKGDNFYAHAGTEFPTIEIETFPKQDMATDLGNLVRLPLGVHRKSKSRAYFIDIDHPEPGLHEVESLPALKGYDID
jgi:hypothetical protein